VQEKTTKNVPTDAPVTNRTFWQRLAGNGNGFNLSTTGKIVLFLGVFALLMVVAIPLYQTVPAEQDPGAAIDFPEKWDYGWDVIKRIDDGVEWVVRTGADFFGAINKIVLHGLLDYLESLDLWISGWIIILIIILITGALTWRIGGTIIAGITMILMTAVCTLGLVPLENYFLWLPWWGIIVITGVLAWLTVGVKFAAMATGFLLVISFMGLLDDGSKTMAITLTSTLICIVLGLPLGIIAARSNRFDAIIRPVLDMMQTMPSFVYLIPALMLFGLGKVPAVMATCIYAIPPIIRLTNLGIRQVDAQVIEAAKSFGTTPSQLLIKVQAPMALPTILAGLNQTVMMALAMVVIAAMIGAAGLGTEILQGITRLEVGRGFLAGISIVFMAIILDRISQGFAKRPEARPVSK
jgi:glycine betaine/proline transport system permease protein